MQRGSDEPNKMTEESGALKQNIVSAFGFPDHLKTALHAWIDSVESRMGSFNVEDPSDKLSAVAQKAVDAVAALEKRMTAIESTVTELHSALSSSPAPVGVQKAVADIDPVAKT